MKKKNQKLAESLTDLWSGWSGRDLHCGHSGACWCEGGGCLLSGGLSRCGGCAGDFSLEAGKHLHFINNEFSWGIFSSLENDLHTGGVCSVRQLGNDGASFLISNEDL